MGEKTMIVYRADALNSAEDLQNACNYDETSLGKLIKIDLAALETADGVKVNAVTYERVGLGSGIHLGHLVIKRFTDESDATLKIHDLTQAGARPVLPSGNPTANQSRAKAFIGGNTVNILVFRL